MAKGEWKVSHDDDSSGDDHAHKDDSDSDSDDDEYESSTYDDLAKLLKKYTKIIIKTRGKNESLRLRMILFYLNVR